MSFADDKLGQCIVRSEFSEYSVTALVKRLQAAASRQKRLPPRANHDDAREDEHGGDAECEAHGQTARPTLGIRSAPHAALPAHVALRGQ